MITILCSSYEVAKAAFRLFMNVLEHMEIKEDITNVWSECLCVETDCNLRYIFTDYRMEGVFEKIGADIIDENEFLQGLDEMRSM